jgi:hypothetical protein
MKTAKYLNTFAIGLPLLIIITYPIFKESSILYSLLSTMVTGFIQVILGLWMLYNNPNDPKLQLYITSVLGFFTLWFINAQIEYKDILSYFLFPIPLILAIYLSVLIYKKTN